MSAFKPLGERVLVKRETEGESMRGGIIIPDSAKEKPQSGKVEATGDGRITPEGKVIPLKVKIGDRVLFPKYHGVDVPFLGDDYLILKEDEILGVVI